MATRSTTTATRSRRAKRSRSKLTLSAPAAERGWKQGMDQATEQSRTLKQSSLRSASPSLSPLLLRCFSFSLLLLGLVCSLLCAALEPSSRVWSLFPSLRLRLCSPPGIYLPPQALSRSRRTHCQPSPATISSAQSALYFAPHTPFPLVALSVLVHSAPLARARYHSYASPRSLARAAPVWLWLLLSSPPPPSFSPLLYPARSSK